MNPQNPLWMTLGGDPITGRVPTQARVTAPPGQTMTEGQAGFVAQMYQTFCASVRCSAFPGGYHVQNRTAPDGTAVRMESVNGVHRVFVQVPGGPSTELKLPSGIGICVTDAATDAPFASLRVPRPGNTYWPQPLLLKPGAKKIIDPDDSTKHVFRSDGEWRVSRLERITGSRKVWSSSDRKHYFGTLGTYRYGNDLDSWTIWMMSSGYADYADLNPEWFGSSGGRYSQGEKYSGSFRYVLRGNETFRFVEPSGFRYVVSPPFVSAGNAWYFHSEKLNAESLTIYRAPLTPKLGMWAPDIGSKSIDGQWTQVQTLPIFEGVYFPSLVVKGDGKQALVRAYHPSDVQGYALLSVDELSGSWSCEFQPHGPETTAAATLSYDLDTTITEVPAPVDKVGTFQDCNGAQFQLPYQEAEGLREHRYAGATEFRKEDKYTLVNRKYWDRDDKLVVEDYTDYELVTVTWAFDNKTTSRFGDTDLPRGVTMDGQTFGPYNLTAALQLDYKRLGASTKTVTRYEYESLKFNDRELKLYELSVTNVYSYEEDSTAVVGGSESTRTGFQKAGLSLNTRRVDRNVLLHLCKLGVTFLMEVDRHYTLNEPEIDTLGNLLSSYTFTAQQTKSAKVKAVGPDGAVLFAHPVLVRGFADSANFTITRTELRRGFTTSRSPGEFSTSSGYTDTGVTQTSAPLVAVAWSQTACPPGSSMPGGYINVGGGEATMLLNGRSEGYTTQGASEPSARLNTIYYENSYSTFSLPAASHTNSIDNYVNVDFAEDPTTSACVVQIEGLDNTQAGVWPFKLLLVVDDGPDGAMRVGLLSERVPEIPAEAALWQKYQGNSLMTI